MYAVVLITTKNKTEANKISSALVKEKLAACVNIVSGVDSIFYWQGKREKAKEALLILKTKRSLLKKLTARVKKLHSYTVPEVIALPIIAGNADYLKWISDSVEK